MPNWLLFLGPSFIWGTTWFAIKFQLGHVPPEVSVVYRFGLASLVLFTWCLVRRIPLRFEARTHAKLVLLGGLQYALNYVLVYTSEGYLTSGLVAVIFALMVAWNFIGARILFKSPVSPRIVVGAGLGVLGVALVFFPEVAHVRGTATQLRGVTLAVLATLAASAGNLWSQHVYAEKTAIAPSTAWAMLYATIGVAAHVLAQGIPFVLDTSFAYLTSLAYLTVFGSVFAFLGFLTLLKRIGAGRAGYTAVVIPVLAMATSTVFEGYRWTPLALIGTALVLGGNVLVLRTKQPAAPRAAS